MANGFVCISMAIAKTASRNVAFKVARMREAIMEDQDELITRKSDSEDVCSFGSQQHATWLSWRI